MRPGAITGAGGAVSVAAITPLRRIAITGHGNESSSARRAGLQNRFLRYVVTDDKNYYEPVIRIVGDPQRRSGAH